jgi:phosphate starvation-inducible PhoH-like protein
MVSGSELGGRNTLLATDSASREFQLDPVDNARLANLCGPLDEHLHQIEQSLSVDIRHRGNRFQVSGSGEQPREAERLLKRLFVLTAKEVLTPHQVHLSLREIGMIDEPQLRTGVAAVADDTDASAEDEAGGLRLHTLRGNLQARGANQKQYLNHIRQFDMTFGIGPAGTGKTYLAVACAVEALQTDRVRRIVLVRPAVEAGERLGFLPGDLAQKVDPYLRPMYDALYEMMGFDRVARFVERGVIEVAPLAFMRGRSLNDAFIILDEAQNTTVEQMKMFLTRIGFGSKAVVTGDITQTDLPAGRASGLQQAIEVLRDVEGVAFTFFTARDVVRHPLVQRIVQAYERKGLEKRGD